MTSREVGEKAAYDAMTTTSSRKAVTKTAHIVISRSGKHSMT
jgi:hypothetical protein